MSALLIFRTTANEIAKTLDSHSLLLSLSVALMEIGEEERPCAALKPRQVRHSTCWKAHSDDERTPRIAVFGNSRSAISLRATERLSSKLCVTTLTTVSFAIVRKIRSALIT